MRATDNRYLGEQVQFQLAMRMIRHEARTRTIKECTGLSDDRIRKIFTTYFKASTDVRRRRGKSPRQVLRFVKSAEHRLQATTLIALFSAGRVIRIEDDHRVLACWPRPDVDLGHRLCRAYETYLLLHDRRLYNFEWAWNLLQSICCNDELYLASCEHCAALFIQDAYSLADDLCPACELIAMPR